MKLNSLQYIDLVVDLIDCYVLAIVPKASSEDSYKSCGLNVAMVIDSNDPFESIMLKDFSKAPLSCYLLGEDGVKIPVDISAGSLNDNGTSSYYGYVHPLMFGSIELGKAYKAV